MVRGLPSLLAATQSLFTTAGRPGISARTVAMAAVPVILDGAAPLATHDDEPGALSVLSWNVLIPNSGGEGWWTHKMYSPELGAAYDDEHSAWPFRQALMRRCIEQADADVVCLQECTPAHFDEDFAFMRELGYDGCELMKRGRFRPATFWRTARVTLEGSPVHRDRCLLTSFRLNTGSSGGGDALGAAEDPIPTRRAVHVINCHLNAGPAAQRRLRQTLEVLDYIRKDWTKQEQQRQERVRAVLKQEEKRRQHQVRLEEKGRQEEEEQQQLQQQQQPPHEGAPTGDPTAPPPTTTDADQPKKTKSKQKQGGKKGNSTKIVVPARTAAESLTVVMAGDFNSDASTSGVGLLLEKGSVDASVFEDGIQLVTKTKQQQLGTFVNTYRHAFHAHNRTPPPTMVCASLLPRMAARGVDLESDVAGGGPEALKLAPGMIQSWRSMFQSFASATTPALLSVEEVTAAEVWPIRHRVMWPDADFNSVKVPGDEDPTTAVHLALKAGPDVVSVVSLFFPVPDPAADAVAPADAATPALAAPPAAPPATPAAAPASPLVACQLRKFATETWAQGNGLGSRLLAAAQTAAHARGAFLWCDAREEQVPFYEKRGWTVTGAPFMRRGRPYVRMENRRGKPPPALAEGETIAVPVMTRADAVTWLETINGAATRGSEMRTAAVQMGWTPPPAEPTGVNTVLSCLLFTLGEPCGTEQSNEQTPSKKQHLTNISNRFSILAHSQTGSNYSFWWH